MNTIAEVSTELRRTLGASGFDQKTLRESVGLSRQTMSNVLKGTEDFKLSTLLAVADRLGLALVLVPKAAARGLQSTDTQTLVETRVDRVRKRLGTDSLEGNKR